MNFKSCKKNFDRLDDAKKFNILSTAMNEFSSNGFNSTNINLIAEKANISVGAMYKYFESKRTLYLTCVEWSFQHLNTKIEEIVKLDYDVITLFEKVIQVIQQNRKENESFTKLYYEMATESNAEFAMMISSQIEGVTSNLYAAFIEHAKTNKLIRQDIDSRLFAFFIDNILMMLQFSYSCEYYKDRMKIYTYPDILENDQLVLDQIMLFVKGALFYKESEE